VDAYPISIGPRRRVITGNHLSGIAGVLLRFRDGMLHAASALSLNEQESVARQGDGGRCVLCQKVACGINRECTFWISL